MGAVPPESDYLIVGAGCFGASTALYLSQSHPSAKITLIDRTPFPNPSAAAHDLNKIIRADYPDIQYMRLALEAQEQWRNDPIYSPYYHQTGMLFAEDFGMGKDAFQNFQELLGDRNPASLLDPVDARQRFDGIFGDAKWDGVKKNFYNPTSGWGEADSALQNLIQNAIDNDVDYLADGVVRVVFDSSTGAASSVVTASGRTIAAKSIILCTGAYTAALLADSAPGNSSIQVDGRMVAAAAVTCYARIPEERRARFRNAPVMFNGLDHTHGESIPLTPDGCLKFTFELSFTNKQLHKASNQIISVPPSRLTQSTWSHDVPQTYKDEVRTVMKHIYGKELAGIEPENYRMCWDAVTPNQDWIISPHPHCANLYIAGGGSFHAWKFLPNIGKYITQMLDKTLDPALASKWAWDRADEGAACEMYIPTRDLGDVIDKDGRELTVAPAI